MVGKLFFLQIETCSCKENATFSFKFMNMNIATNFEAVKFRVYHIVDL